MTSTLYRLCISQTRASVVVGKDDYLTQVVRYFCRCRIGSEA